MVMKKTVKKTEEMSCATSCCNKTSALWAIAGVVVVFAISFLAAKMAVQNMEVMRAGGSENYKMIKELYKSDAWKQTQAMQIQQTMQALQGQAAGAMMPTEQAAPEVAQ
jgi:hypothetical protein